MTSANQHLQRYRLVPVAADYDQNWDRAPSHGVVTVCARSAADARVVAAEAEGDFTDVSAKPGDGNSTAFASAFRDDKLYAVEDDGPCHEGDARGVVAGQLSGDVLKVSEAATKAGR